MSKRKLTDSGEDTLTPETADKIPKTSSSDDKKNASSLPPALAKRMAEWQQQKKTVAQRDGYILENEMYTDCVFSIFGEAEEPEQIKCHRVYLAKSSPVFSSMFYGDMKKDSDEAIHLPDVNLKSFKAMLNYVYCGEVDLTSYSYEVVCGFLYVAKKYLLPDTLLETIYGYVWTNMYPENMWIALEFAENNNEPELEQAAWEIIQLKTEESLEPQHFPKITIEKLVKLTTEGCINISEAPLFNMCVRWAESQASRLGRTPDDPSVLRDILAPIIPNIRFMLMKGTEFVNTVVNTKILTTDEMCPILSNYQVQNSQQLPNTICPSKEERKQPKFSSLHVHGTPKDQCQISKLKVGDSMPDYTGTVYLENFEKCKMTTLNGIAGFVIPTQTNTNNQLEEYEEEITVFFTANDNRKILFKEYSLKKVKYNNVNLITFRTPYWYEGDSYTDIFIAFHKSGRYPLNARANIQNLKDYVLKMEPKFKDQQISHICHKLVLVCIISQKTNEEAEDLENEDRDVESEEGGDDLEEEGGGDEEEEGGGGEDEEGEGGEDEEIDVEGEEEVQEGEGEEENNSSGSESGDDSE